MSSNITHIRGDTFIRNLTFKDSTGVPINLTGSNIIFSIKEKYDSTEFIIKQNLEIVDPINGKAKIFISAENMKLEVKSYIFDIEWTDGSGVVTTINKGNFIISYDVTN